MICKTHGPYFIHNRPQKALDIEIDTFKKKHMKNATQLISGYKDKAMFRTVLYPCLEN